MPGMLERFDAYFKAQADEAREQELRDQQWRQHQGMLGRGGMLRLFDLLQGGQPTREPIEQWMQHRSAPGMLQQRIDGRIVPRRDPPRRPTGGRGVRG